MIQNKMLFAEKGVLLPPNKMIIEIALPRDHKDLNTFF